jgi:antitoxin (DNA-binding transcriptional repressor) of toxin-antitoxin stability system
VIRSVFVDIQVSKSRFRTRALEFFRHVETSGETVVVTDRGQPRLEVRPFRLQAHDSPLDVLRGSVLRYDDPIALVAEEGWEALRWGCTSRTVVWCVS